MDNISPSHLPYLEKHRIFELFHELARELVIQQPNDHVEFLKNILINARKATETSRVIILASPKIHCFKIATAIANHTKQILICLNNDINELPPDSKIEYIQNLVRQPQAYQSGWILVDCIQTREDAETLIQRGILPTHVLHLVAPYEPKFDEILYCNVPKYWPNYRREITQIRDVFKKVLKEIHLTNKRSGDVVNECVRVIGLKKVVCAIKPRILIVGPRGSGRKTQAELLVEKLKIIHVDFEQLIYQIQQTNTEIGRKLRNYNNEIGLDSEISTQIINKRILDEECLSYGWVMTGFPSTELDFKYLDSLDTPPNRLLIFIIYSQQNNRGFRVIFLECDLAICKERLQNDLISIESLDKQLNIYCENCGNLRKYCGNSANYIDANQNSRYIHENIMAIIANSLNPTPPRRGFK